VQQIVPPLRDRYPVLGANLRSIAAWQEGCRAACAAIATLDGLTGTLNAGGEPQGIVAARVSANLLDVFGIRPLLGRGFQSTDMVAGSDGVLLLSYELWQQRFGGDAHVIGRMVTLDGVSRQVIGVLPELPRLPRLERLTPIRRWVGPAQALVPFVPRASQVQSPGDFSYVAIVRLREGVTAAQVHEQLTPITQAAFTDAPFRPEVLVRPLGDHVVADVRRPLYLLLGAVVAMLVIACVNVAHLVAGRWLARRRELAIRLALGARAADLLRHVGAEAICLALAGGALAVAVCYGALTLVVTWAPADTPRLDEVSVDMRALSFGLIATVVCTVLSCLLPVRRVIRTSTRSTLDESAHSVSEPQSGLRIRRALVALEVVTTAALLIVAGLLLVSVVRLNGVDRGFVASGRMAVDLTLSRVRYPQPSDRTRLLDSILEAVGSLPEVEVAAVAQKLPLEGESSVDLLVPHGSTPFDGQPQPVGSHVLVSPHYFRALQRPLRAGRTFTEEDRARRVAVVTESTARTLWPNQDPIGQRFTRTRGQEVWEVIGVVADTHTESLERAPGLAAYFPHWDERNGQVFSVVVATLAKSDSLLTGVQRAIQGVDPELATLNPRTMEQVVRRTTASRRLQMWLTIAFAAVGLVIACLGIYAVIAAGVLRRRRELALRRAFGASDGHIARMVLGEGLLPVVAGLVIGSAAAAALGTVVAALLFEVSPYDPLVFAVVAGLIMLCALAACAAPLVRALRTAPILALRGS